MTHEEYLQWLEYKKDEGDVTTCPMCHRYIAWDELIVNNGMCDDCFYEMAKDDIKKGVI